MSTIPFNATIVSTTNNDATEAKSSAVKKGYFEDAYISYFDVQDKYFAPLIRRGYYTRVMAIRSLMQKFLESSVGVKQVLNIGAGFDTSFWRILDQGYDALFYEVDMPDIVARKSAIIQDNEVLMNRIEEGVFEENGNVFGKNYCLIGGDLRDIESLEVQLCECGLRRDLPVLILSECVLVYIDPVCSMNLISWSSSFFDQSVFIIYEQINPFDNYGKTMKKNLIDRGCPIVSIEAYPDTQSQEQRMRDGGYTEVRALNMNEVTNLIMTREELMRLNRVEMLDEYEEWNIIQSHYCIVSATQEKNNAQTFKEIQL